MKLNHIVNFLDIQEREILANIEQELDDHWGQKNSAMKFLNALSKEELFSRMKYIRSFKRMQEYNLELPITAELCEFFGIMLGDGCISKYTAYKNVNRCDIVITGDKRYEQKYYNYIELLLKNNFNVNYYIFKSNTDNSIRLFIRNKRFSDFLLKIGYQSGEKARTATIPENFMNLEWNLLKNIIKGIYDTDGTIFAHKRE